jgi:hypothetical protein
MKFSLLDRLTRHFRRATPFSKYRTNFFDWQTAEGFLFASRTAVRPVQPPVSAALRP